LVDRAGIEPATPGFSVPPGRLPLTSARVRKQLHDSVSGSWKLPPMSAGVCHFPRDRHTFGTPFWAAHRGPRRPAPADQRRRGSGAARGYWSLLAATMKGQVFSFEHLGCLVVGATGTKANGGGYFVAGLLRRWQCFHRLTRPGCAYLLPPNLLRSLPLNGLQLLGFGGRRCPKWDTCHRHRSAATRRRSRTKSCRFSAPLTAVRRAGRVIYRPPLASGAPRGSWAAGGKGYVLQMQHLQAGVGNPTRRGRCPAPDIFC